MDTTNKGFETKLVHAGSYEDEFGSATVPIYQTSTFAFKNAQHGADLFALKEFGNISKIQYYLHPRYCLSLASYLCSRSFAAKLQQKALFW